MVYILRTNIKRKYILEGLKSVCGIGFSASKKICFALGFQKTFVTEKIKTDYINAIIKLVPGLKIKLKSDLQRELKNQHDFLAKIKTYRGIRYKQGLPTRGQRTRTNSRTLKKLRLKKQRTK